MRRGGTPVFTYDGQDVEDAVWTKEVVGVDLRPREPHGLSWYDLVRATKQAINSLVRATKHAYINWSG